MVTYQLNFGIPGLPLSEAGVQANLSPDGTYCVIPAGTEWYVSAATNTNQALLMGWGL